MKHNKLFAVLSLLVGCTINIYDEPEPGDEPPPPSSQQPGETRRIFVTSAAYQGGGLGGLAGADEKCAAHAEAAGLDGTFLAWLSTDDSSPATRMSQRVAPFELVDGTRVAATWTDLVDGELLHAIDRDEHGEVYTAAPTCMAAINVWSATRFDGQRLPNATFSQNCNNWTDLTLHGALGNVQQANTAWTDYGCSAFCTSRAAIYCVEQ
jgi:hypothetical protein